MPFSRRTIIAGAGGAMVALAPLPWRQVAAAGGTNGIASISDGTLQVPASLVLPNKDQETVAAVLGDQDFVTPDCNVTLWRTGERTVLFDAGSGSQFVASAGKLPANLAEAGVALEDVTDIVFTHAHPDHIWGVLDEFDDLTYPNARYFVPAAEWAFWLGEETPPRIPDAQQAFAVGARNRFDAIKERVSFVEPGDEVLPGVEAVDTAGHTPGHTSYVVHAAAPVLVVGDALSHAVVSFQYPDWVWGTDLDAEKAAATRRTLLDRIAADGLAIIGFHLPHPGRGTAERDGSAYRYVAS